MNFAFVTIYISTDNASELNADNHSFRCMHVSYCEDKNTVLIGACKITPDTQTVVKVSDIQRKRGS